MTQDATNPLSPAALELERGNHCIDTVSEPLAHGGHDAERPEQAADNLWSLGTLDPEEDLPF